MKTTAQRRKLIEEARVRGLTVRETNSCVHILTGKTFKSVGITLWPDGTATRSDIDFQLCTTIRTIKLMRIILGL
jgi:hypothetical protein